MTDNYGVNIQRASATPAWRATVRHLTGAENRGRHNVFIDAIGEDGKSIRRGIFTVGWTWQGKRADEIAEPVGFTKPVDEPGADIPMGWGQKVELWLNDPTTPSDHVLNLHTAHPNEDSGNTTGHHSFHVRFQKEEDTEGLPPPPPNETRAALVKMWEELGAIIDALKVDVNPLPAANGDNWTLNILARTLYGEARGEGEVGMVAVAHVILNRAKIGGWWGDTVVDVCLKPYQFSCWNPPSTLIDLPDDEPDLQPALEVARKVLAGETEDPVDGATHYYADYIDAPSWVEGATFVCQIGAHLFYKGIR